MMKALFIGGTGLISLSITQALAKDKRWQLTLLNRGQRAPAPEGVEVLHGDIHDEAAVRELIRDRSFDVVANFINFTPDQIERDIRLFAGKTRQYIFISSASAYQKPLSHYVITESTPLSNPFWQYSRDKIACEERLIREYRENGFPITIVRPSHTYDCHAIPMQIHGEHGSWQNIQRILQGKPVIMAGDGTSLWTITHSRDFAKGFIGLMGNPHALGEAVQIMSDESLTWNQLYDCIGSILGKEVKKVHVATDFLTALDPEQKGPLWGDKCQTVVFDTSKLKRLVPGFCATISAAEGLRESIDFAMRTPGAQCPDPAFDAWCEKVLVCRQMAIDAMRG